jgi:putative ABC transport system permease protein
METLWQDLRYCARMLIRKPAYTVIAVFTLAFGIGANSAIFSVVNAVLLRPLPFKNPDSVVQFWETNPLKGWTQATVAPANLFDWQKQNTSFEDIAAYMGSDTKGEGTTGFHLTTGGEPLRVEGLFVTGNLFSVLGVEAAHGRTLLPEETIQGKSLVVLLSHGLWQRQFGADPTIVGREITLNGRNRTVVGIMPERFYFPSKDVEMWTPMGWDESQMATLRRPHFLRAVGRLKPGVTLEAARAEMTVIAGRLAEQYPDTNTEMGVGLGPAKEWIVEETRPALILFLAAVAFVLLIACANVANLLLARAASRQKEIALRTALGASRGRILRQLLTESFLLSALGGSLGLLLALWSKELLVAFSPGDIPRLEEASLDAGVLIFTLGLVLLTTLLFGLAPALQYSKPDLTASLKEGGQKTAGGAQGRKMRSALVVSEFALSLVLVIGAGLMIRSLIALQDVDPGVETDNVLTLRVALPGAKYGEDHQAIKFFEQAEQRIESLPGVVSAGATTTLPLKGYNWTGDMTIEGRSEEDYVREVRHKQVTPSYFETIGARLLAGRGFTAFDNEKSEPVVIVNERLAQRYFPEGSAVDKRIKLSKPTEDSPWRTIIGVVSDEKQDSLASETKPEIFQSHLQYAQTQMSIVVRTSVAPESLIGAVRGEIRALDKDLPPYDIKTMREVLYESASRERFTTLLLAVFATLALALAAVGIYGVMSYTISQRTHEIGVRMALGAGSGDVLRLILGQGLRLALAGVGVGLLAAFVLTRLMSKLLYGVSATDPVTFAAIALLLATVALAACYIPARRATRVDPMVALRHE